MTSNCLKAKGNGNANRVSEDIERTYKDGNWQRKRALFIMKTTNNGRNRTSKSRKIQMSWRKGDLHILWDIGSEHHQTCGEERKIFLKISQEYEKKHQIQSTRQKSHQRDKYLGCPPRETLGTILKVDEGRTLINGPENKKKTMHTVLRPRVIIVRE